MTVVIAVANNKGGVAKTTTCLSLGGSLAEQGWEVLLVDMDPQAHLTASLGIKPETARRTVGDVLLAQSSLVSVSHETAVAGLDIVPANRDLVVLDKVLYKRPGYEYRLRSDVDRLHHGLYDFVLLDCPPSFGTLTLNGLTAADMLIVPTQCEYYAARSLHQMLDMVRLVRRKSNPMLSYRLLVTMFDGRNRIHRFILKYLRASFSKGMFQTVIQVDTRLRESPAFGLPVTRYAPKTRAAQQYRLLATELVAGLQPRVRPASETEQVSTQSPTVTLSSTAVPETRAKMGAVGL